MVRLLVVAASVALVACTSETTEPTPTAPPPAPAACEDPLELALPSGACIRPGILPDACAEGFVHDGEYGCEPVLPAAPCAPGLMAVPGEAECRAVMDCGTGKWGNIAVDATTQYVDGSYSGGGSDGSEARPWTTVSAAVAAAGNGSLIAIASGNYREDVVVTAPLRLAGVCPEQVSIEGTGQSAGGCPPAALCIGSGGDASEVSGLSLHGASAGLVISGVLDVLVDRIRVHETVGQGINAQNSLGPTSLTVQGSLVEQVHDVGVAIIGSDATIESSVVRATQLGASTTGRGIEASVPCTGSPTAPVCDASARANATVRGSVVEQNHEGGIYITGSDVLVEASVVRTTQPDSAQQSGGGITVRPVCNEASVDYVCAPASQPTATVRGSLVDQNHNGGIAVFGGAMSVETSVVRGTLPQASDLSSGRGITIQLPCTDSADGPVCDYALRPSVTVLSSLIEKNHDIGMFVSGADAVVEASVVRATQPRAADQKVGRGMNIQYPCTGSLGGLLCDRTVETNATVLSSLIEQNYDMGVFFAGVEAVVQATVVRATLARALDGLYGDGIVVVGPETSKAVTIADVRIDDSARAGFGNFGAIGSLGATRIGCAAFALSGEPLQQQDFAFEDRGDNLCGCPVPDQVCKVISAGLEPPEL